MAHLLLLALCVATSNSIALHAPARVKTLGAARSALALLKAGDFEHLARQFSNSEGILALTLPGSRQRCLVIHESRADLARKACASSVLKDRVAGDVAFPGLTRQRDGERYAAAKTALNSALCGADARRRIGQTAFAAAFDADHIHDDDAYALCVARLALRATLFGDDEDTATAFLGPAALATAAAAPPPPSRARPGPGTPSPCPRRRRRAWRARPGARRTARRRRRHGCGPRRRPRRRPFGRCAVARPRRTAPS